MRFRRAAGVLCHPTSFPSRYGIGDLGDHAYAFVDFLVAARQSLWQVLPLGPTGYGDSPYQSFSAFAGNTLLIDPDRLVADAYLPDEAVADVPEFPELEVDFGPVIEYKNTLLNLAFEQFQAQATPEQQANYDAFCNQHASWLEDYALFMAIKNRHIEHEGGVWNTWPEPIARRRLEAMVEWSRKLRDDIERHKFLQFLFFEQWLALKQYANTRGIRIIGDIPIFVAFDSADVWANPELFYLDETGAPSVVAGVPPDYFSRTGQRWGNPLYRWGKMAADNYRWWVERLRMAFTQVDILRIDHFRGFEAYWEIPASEPTAVIGQWVKGPDHDFFRAMQAQLGQLPLIAEDLGVITPEVEALRDDFGFPGMKILQFAFGGERNSTFLPHNFPLNSVVYTGTHDNETVLGWYRNASEDERDHVRRYTGSDGRDIVWRMIRLAMASVADMAVVPLQDLMELDNKARMNFPSTASGNWRWRYAPDMLAPHIGSHLAELTELFERAPATVATVEEGQAEAAQGVISRNRRGA